MHVYLLVQQTNQKYIFFLTCRPPVCVWRRFMHCWFNGLLSERFWRLLSEKKPRNEDDFYKNVHMSCLLNLKWSVQIWPGSRQPISSQGLNATYIQWWDSQGHIRSIVLLLRSAERQHKIMCSANNGRNIGLLLTPVWFHVKFPFQMTCPQDKVLVAILKAEGG